MTKWTSDELNKIGAAEELQIASLRRDGTRYGLRIRHEKRDSGQLAPKEIGLHLRNSLPWSGMAWCSRAAESGSASFAD